MHFGTPVVPLEYTIRNGSLNATLSKSNTALPFAASKNASRETVRGKPSRPAGLPGKRGCETTPLNSCTPSMPLTISLILGRKSIVLPLYTVQSSTKTYAGLICSSRSSIPLVPMSVLLELNSPPRLTTAMNVMNVSKLVLATTATRSPFLTPCARIAFASKPTRRRSSPHERWRTSVLPSRTSVSAILVSSLCCVERLE